MTYAEHEVVIWLYGGKVPPNPLCFVVAKLTERIRSSIMLDLLISIDSLQMWSKMTHSCSPQL